MKVSYFLRLGSSVVEALYCTFSSKLHFSYHCFGVTFAHGLSAHINKPLNFAGS